MKHCILQDSSFLIATIDTNDCFHKDAVYIFQKILSNKRDVKIIIPSLVFYETIVTLIKKGGMPRELIEKKLWNFLYSNLVLNVAQIETNAFKMCKKLSNFNLTYLGTQDFIISSIGMDYEAQILTFDQNFRKRVGSIYEKIYYCSQINWPQDETPRFLSDLNKYLGKGEIDINDIPF